MHPAALDRSLPRQLDSLLALDGRDVHWGIADLAGLLRHQLSVPLRAELSRLGLSPRESFAASGGHVGDARPTFADVLTAKSPPLELLCLLKEFGKVCDKDAEHPLPSQVAALLYYASIFAARLRHGVRISKLTDQELREGVEWVSGRPWLDPRLLPLIDATMRLLQDGASRPPRRSDG